MPEEADEDIDDQGGAQGKHAGDQRPGHDLVEFHELGMGDNQKNHVHQYGEKDVVQRIKIVTEKFDHIQGADDGGHPESDGEIQHPGSLRSRRPVPDKENHGTVAEGQNGGGIEINEHPPIRPVRQGGEQGDEKGHAGERRCGGPARRKEALIVEEAPSEGHEQRGNGHKAAQLDQIPDVGVKVTGKETSSLVEKNGQAKPGKR